MVVLTIVAQKNGETIFFNEPIPQVHFMKLISCSLYNSWNTLKREGSAELGFKKDPSVSVGKIPAGHYNLESMAEAIKKNFRNIQLCFGHENKHFFWPARNRKYWHKTNKP